MVGCGDVVSLVHKQGPKLPSMMSMSLTLTEPSWLMSPRQVVGQSAQVLPTQFSHLQGSSRDPKLFCYIDSSLGMRCVA